MALLSGRECEGNKIPPPTADELAQGPRPPGQKSQPSAEQLNDILQIWKRGNSRFPFFVRFINGNTKDISLENLEYVHITEALNHVVGPELWVVDWDSELTPDQVKTVFRAVLNGMNLT